MKLCITDTSLMYRDDILNFHNNEQMMILQSLKTILCGYSNIQKIGFVYDYLMNKNDFPGNKECVIYGAGENAINLYNVLCKKHENITSFVVSDSYKCGRRKLLNLPVYSKDWLPRKNGNVILIIAVSFPSCLEIFRNIEDLDFYKILLW